MSQPLIEIKNVTKSFKSLVAVNDLILTIHEREFVALLGPNGAGKTTLIEMIEGLQRPDRGTIEIMGMNWEFFPFVVSDVLRMCGSHNLNYFM